MPTDSTPASLQGRELPESFPADLRAPVLAQSAAFVREHSLRIIAISAAVLLPCFWHHRIVAGDLGSHVYNAWLALLVQRGQAPGVWLTNRWNNVLFDFM